MSTPYHPPLEMSRSLLSLLFVLIAGPSLAEIRNYKSWPSSPEAYFLTSPEREEWAKITTDEGAEEFVLRYFEKRGPDFQEELLRRIELADRYFSLHKKRGAETIRGKLVILLGPPTRLQRSGGTELSRTGDLLSRGTVRPSLFLRFEPIVETLTWWGERLGNQRVVVRVLVQPSGRETIQGSKKDLERLDALLDSTARASIASPSKSADR